MKELCDRLQECASAKGVAQSDIARACGFQSGTLSRYFSGDSVPKAFELLKLARYFGVSMEWLLVGDEARNPDSTRLAEESISYAAPQRLTEAGMKKILAAMEDFKESLDKLRGTDDLDKSDQITDHDDNEN